MESPSIVKYGELLSNYYRSVYILARCGSKSFELINKSYTELMSCYLSLTSSEQQKVSLPVISRT